MTFRRSDEPELDALRAHSPSRWRPSARAAGSRRPSWPRLTGTTQSAVARLERGTRPPRLDTLLRIANALDCELEVTLRPRTIERKP